MVEIILKNDGLTFESRGLRAVKGYEISATVGDPALIEDCRIFLKFVSTYLLGGNTILNGETLGYGFWVTKAIENESGTLVFWELQADTRGFIPGINRTMLYWRQQQSVCHRAASEFAPPAWNQLAVISDGVYEGDTVQGVRYPSPPHMSGWWITTDRYDGDIASLKTVHIHHIAERRPDLVKFLALSDGHRFYSDTGEVVFDPAADT